VIERFEKDKEQYRAICDHFGTQLEVIKEAPFNTESTRDITEYRFYLSLNDMHHSFHIINGNTTVIRCETKSIDQFKFYILKSNWINQLLRPASHVKIKDDWYKWNCSHKDLGKRITQNRICEGFLQMASSVRIKVTGKEGSTSEIDNYKQFMIVEIDNAPVDHLKIAPSLESMKRLHSTLS